MVFWENTYSWLFIVIPALVGDMKFVVKLSLSPCSVTLNVLRDAMFRIMSSFWLGTEEVMLRPVFSPSKFTNVEVEFEIASIIIGFWTPPPPPPPGPLPVLPVLLVVVELP